MDRRIVAAVAATCAALLPAAPASALVAFPGAEGFGANAAGGRGGDVYHVTTLIDDPNHLTPGSLFYGLYEKNVPGSGTVPGVGRTIVFDVGGTIHLGSSTLDIKNIKNVTIAGQTAPSPITIVGNTVQITSSGGKETGNIILQHVAIRKGLANSGDSLTIKGSGNTHDIMVDHVSGSWSEDEVISVAGATNHSQNVTVQYSTMSEALTSGHQYGALIRNDQSESVSYNHNLFSDNASRNPRPGTYLGTQLDFEFQNNVVYNWSDRAGYTGGASETDTENVNMNYAGNYLIAGPSTVGGPTTPGGTPVIGARRNTEFTKDASNDPLNLHVYQSGNKIDWGSSVSDPSRHGQDIGWTAFANWNGTSSSAFPTADRNASPFAYPAAAALDSPDTAYAKMIGAVGAFPWARTVTDQRLINEVLTYGGVAAQTAPNSAEWNAIDTAPTVTRDASWDTDHDGMPNYWETLRGFNPAAADNNTITSDGYTRLEHYLQYASLIANWNLDANGNWSDDMSWRGMRPQSLDASANFVAGITAPRTVTIDIPVTVGQMSFAGSVPYTLAGASAITLHVIGGTATIDVQGSHMISAPLALADNTRVTDSAAGDTLTVSNLQPTSATLGKAGPGTLVVNNVRAGGLTVSAGIVRIQPNASASGTSRVSNLTIAAGAKLDLSDNKLIVTSGGAGSWNGSAYTGVIGQVAAGYNGGAWNGSGIVTSMSSAISPSVLTALVAMSAADAGYAGGTFGGISVSGSDALVMYTWGGDANMDGTLNGDDYFQIDSHFNQAGAVFGYNNGDFNYDGDINGDDYFIIDSNWNTGSTSTPFPTAGTLTGVSVVPDPAGGILAPLAAAALVRRRRRV